MQVQRFGMVMVVTVVVAVMGVLERDRCRCGRVDIFAVGAHAWLEAVFEDVVHIPL